MTDQTDEQRDEFYYADLISDRCFSERYGVNYELLSSIIGDALQSARQEGYAKGQAEWESKGYASGRRSGGYVAKIIP